MQNHRSNTGALVGGAILIAANGTISVEADGRITANGGAYGGYGLGSGGAVRLIADQLLGSGRIEAIGGNPGRIRLESLTTASPDLIVNPPAGAVSPLPLVIWPPENAPTVRVVSVDGQPAPLDPKAGLGAEGDDVITSTQTSTNTIVLQTANFPTSGTVNVYIKPQTGVQTILQASFVSGTTAAATWQVQTQLPLYHTMIQARAVLP